MTTQGFLSRMARRRFTHCPPSALCKEQAAEASVIKTKEMGEGSGDWLIIVIGTWAMGHPDCVRRAEQSYTRWSPGVFVGSRTKGRATILLGDLF
jgi:hypothetical protein